jgi:hypothetical protein
MDLDGLDRFKVVHRQQAAIGYQHDAANRHIGMSRRTLFGIAATRKRLKSSAKSTF